MSLNCPTSLPLTFWNWTCSTRDCAHSPSLPELHVADHGLERVGADVVGELRVIETLRSLNRLLQHLQLRIAPWRHVVAERIDALGAGLGLVPLDEVANAGNSIFGTGSQKS